ncbi:TetR/AcrR family transcriptional regulator, partial [Kribbia dieselivorans]|uniref:TetR/AcrR family transcriptional regulator n=1 Tax=Kribbia dieselivorans TaxID=331526 RepID=UPI0012ECF2A9
MSLTRGQVIDTAVSILTRFGLADLSMRRLARELDVQPGALYWHVENKQALLVEVAARLLDTVPAGVGRDGDEPAADLKRLVVAVRRALVPIPDAADVVAVAWAVDPGSVPALVAMRALVDDLVEPKAQA